MITGAGLAEGLATTALGMVIVFIVLILLTACLETMKVFASPQSEEEKRAPAAEPLEVPAAVVAAPTNHSEPQAANELELIAVISAALAAYTGRRVSDIRVSSIRRIERVETGWAAQARRDLIDSRRVLGS